MNKRVVIDTNIYISGVLGGNPKSPVKQALAVAYSKHTLLQSPETLAEVQGVLMRDKFDRYFEGRAEMRPRVIAEIMQNSEIIVPTQRLNVSPDPKDNMLFELAQAGHADIIISGNHRDVNDVVFENVQTMTPEEFLGFNNCPLHFAHQAAPLMRTGGVFIPAHIQRPSPIQTDGLEFIDI